MSFLVDKKHSREEEEISSEGNPVRKLQKLEVVQVNQNVQGAAQRALNTPFCKNILSDFLPDKTAHIMSVCRTNHLPENPMPRMRDRPKFIRAIAESKSLARDFEWQVAALNKKGNGSVADKNVTRLWLDRFNGEFAQLNRRNELFASKVTSLDLNEAYFYSCILKNSTTKEENIRNAFSPFSNVRRLSISGSGNSQKVESICLEEAREWSQALTVLKECLPKLEKCEISTSHLAFLGGVFSHVQKLSLDCGCGIYRNEEFSHEEELIEVLRDFNGKKLKLDGFSFFSRDPVALGLVPKPNLTHLTLANNFALTEEQLEFILDIYPNISHLTIRDCPQLTWRVLSKINNKATKLQNLNVDFYSYRGKLSKFWRNMSEQDEQEYQQSKKTLFDKLKHRLTIND